MASWGDVQAYNEMIEELGNFYGQMGQVCQFLDTAANVCADTMEGDSASRNASIKVLKSAKKYAEAADMARKLAVALTEERDALIEYLKTLEEMEESGE